MFIIKDFIELSSQIQTKIKEAEKLVNICNSYVIDEIKEIKIKTTGAIEAWQETILLIQDHQFISNYDEHELTRLINWLVKDAGRKIDKGGIIDALSEIFGSEYLFGLVKKDGNKNEQNQI